MLVWGRHDPVLSFRAAETARDLIPGSRLVVIESGHLPYTTNPAAVAAELTDLANVAFDGEMNAFDLHIASGHYRAGPSRRSSNTPEWNGFRHTVE